VEEVGVEDADRERDADPEKQPEAHGTVNSDQPPTSK
jgi:hypothetical protein